MTGGSSLLGYELNSAKLGHSFVGQVLKSYGQLEVQAVRHAGCEYQTVTYPGNLAHGGRVEQGNPFPFNHPLPFLNTPPDFQSLIPSQRGGT